MPRPSLLLAARAALLLLLAIPRGVLGAAAEGPAAGAPLALEDCVRLAEAAPSPARVAARQADIARARLEQARAGLLPRLAVFAGYTRNSPGPEGPEGGSFVSLNGINQYTGLLTLTEEIDLSGRLRAGWARGRADQRAAEATGRIARRDLRRSVAGAYYRVLLARRLAVVAAEILVDARQFAERTRLLTQKGEAARADIVKADFEVQLLLQAQRAAELDASLANQELAAFWTDEVTRPLALADTLGEAPAPAPTAAAVAVGRRPELGLLEAQIAGLQADARAARAQRYPQASVTAEAGLDANHLAWRDRGWALIFNLSVPVFDWSSAASAARQLSLAAEQLQLEREISRRSFSREYESARLRVTALQEQIAIAREQVSLAEQNLKLSRVRYEGGEGSALDVVTAHSQLAQARASYYQALAGHLQARADLAVAEGQ
jgi:outer membrane protein TolC